MLEARGESPWPAPVVHAEKGGPPKCCLEVLREDPASSYSFQLLSLPLPACQPLPAHWLTRPEGVANGAALSTDTLILARCFSELLKARDAACNFILGHTLAGLLLSLSSPQRNHNPSPSHHTYKPVKWLTSFPGILTFPSPLQAWTLCTTFLSFLYHIPKLALVPIGSAFPYTFAPFLLNAFPCCFSRSTLGSCCPLQLRAICPVSCFWSSFLTTYLFS